MTKELAKNNETAAPAQAPKNITDVVPFTEKIKLELLENIVELKYDKNG